MIPALQVDTFCDVIHRENPSYPRVQTVHHKSELVQQALPYHSPAGAPWASYQIRKMRVAHAPGMLETSSPPQISKETAS